MSNPDLTTEQRKQIREAAEAQEAATGYSADAIERAALSLVKPPKPVPNFYEMIQEIERTMGLCILPARYTGVEHLTQFTAKHGEATSILTFGMTVHRAPLNYIGAAANGEGGR